eukprot:TRINITY_DN3874_c0_g1_i4.p1 TRINITY_DN3874_c0_g1~~TRINITY_DN3874_c0_g1_i4.p1  ORF type:complete len:108 (-),score=7.95 TRINITY_DN3874_c0_g1_i4:1082-1405(-)
MPVPIVPYSTALVACTPTIGARRQLVCSGCRNLLLYAPGATSVCCSVCNVVTSVPPSGIISYSSPLFVVYLWKFNCVQSIIFLRKLTHFMGKLYSFVLFLFGHGLSK